MHGVAHLIGERRVGVRDPRPAHRHHLHRPDPRGRGVGAPRARAEIGRGQPADAIGGHRGAARRVDLRRIAQPLGAREHRGQLDLGLQPTVVVLAARVDDVASPVDREVAHAGEERQVEQLGELGTDLAGVGVDRVAAGEHEIERPVARVLSAAASAFAVASVSDPANATSVTCTPRDVDVAIESPRDRFAQRVVGGGGPSVNTVTREPSRSAASSTALLTARRQYGFISGSMPSRRSRPSGPSSISSNFGICFTNTAMRTDAPEPKLTIVSGYDT